MRGPNLPGRTFKGGFLTAPHLGTPSRLIVLEDATPDPSSISIIKIDDSVCQDPPAGVKALSETEQANHPACSTQITA
ncbi:PDF1A [Symbiodinium sp. CCMP2592]|nr:PDF1A [Symbiodinium sp. CCMP2592]